MSPPSNRNANRQTPIKGQQATCTLGDIQAPAAGVLAITGVCTMDFWNVPTPHEASPASSSKRVDSRSHLHLTGMVASTWTCECGHAHRYEPLRTDDATALTVTCPGCHQTATLQAAARGPTGHRMEQLGRTNEPVPGSSPPSDC